MSPNYAMAISINGKLLLCQAAGRNKPFNAPTEIDPAINKPHELLAFIGDAEQITSESLILTKLRPWQRAKVIRHKVSQLRLQSQFISVQTRKFYALTQKINITNLLFTKETNAQLHALEMKSTYLQKTLTIADLIVLRSLYHQTNAQPSIMMIEISGFLHIVCSKHKSVLFYRKLPCDENLNNIEEVLQETLHHLHREQLLAKFDQQNIKTYLLYDFATINTKVSWPESLHATNIGREVGKTNASASELSHQLGLQHCHPKDILAFPENFNSPQTTAKNARRQRQTTMLTMAFVILINALAISVFNVAKIVSVKHQSQRLLAQLMAAEPRQNIANIAADAKHYTFVQSSKQKAINGNEVLLFISSAISELPLYTLQKIHWRHLHNASWELVFEVSPPAIDLLTTQQDEAALQLLEKRLSLLAEKTFNATHAYQINSQLNILNSAKIVARFEFITTASP